MINTNTAYNWITIGVTALPPGWINVYDDRDGGYLTEPAPALLLEEATTCTHYWCEDGNPLRRTEEIERETRVMFADTGGDGMGLEAAGRCGNYLHSTTEANHALRILDAAEEESAP